jgi:L-ascorbate metabolism protein UlaG (beta-lactamase superfamily)
VSVIRGRLRRHRESAPHRRERGAAVSDRVTFLGHSTTLIETGGMRLLTDPILRDRVWHLRRYAQRLERGDHAGIDVVLISHGHADHLDPASLRMVGTEVTVVVPRGLGGFLRRRRFRDVRVIESGDRIELGPVAIRATPAAHDGRRFPLGPSVRALGYVVEGGSRVYFAGDTDLFAGMDEIGSSLDLALVPVAGWGARVGPGHLDPERAARAVAMLRPRVAVPIHWGTLHAPRLLPQDPSAPPRAFEALVRAEVPGVDPRVLAPGESTEIPHERPPAAER